MSLIVNDTHFFPLHAPREEVYERLLRAVAAGAVIRHLARAGDGGRCYMVPQAGDGRHSFNAPRRQQVKAELGAAGGRAPSCNFP